ncbi:hypothetical protein HY448_01650 [Candidatus Pacearchaeota archaeon]|nr:hypothetical protein [Candidatus Pacearchaeota archaeon]
MNDWKHSGYKLKFYADEHKEFPEAYIKELNSEQARIVISKLQRHFKVGRLSLAFTDRIGGGKCDYGGLIRLRWQTSIGMACHELAHLLGYRKYNIRGHNRKMKRIMARMINYCQKKNYWQEELEKRLAPKPITPEPTKQESRLILIKKREQQIVRYEKKLKYYTKLYSNKLKSARRSILMLKRNVSI